MIEKLKNSNKNSPATSLKQQCWKFAYTSGCIVMPWYFFSPLPSISLWYLHFGKSAQRRCEMKSLSACHWLGGLPFCKSSLLLIAFSPCDFSAPIVHVSKKNRTKGIKCWQRDHLLLPSFDPVCFFPKTHLTIANAVGGVLDWLCPLFVR